MAAGTFTLYDSVALLLGNGAVNLSSDTFKLLLVTSSYTPSAAHDELADITNEVADANGYTTGGITLTSVSWTAASGVAKFTTANAVWTASGGSIVARRCILWDDTSTNDKLIGHMLLDATPGDVTATAGNTLTVGPHATNGWFRQTVNPA